MATRSAAGSAAIGQVEARFAPGLDPIEGAVLAGRRRSEVACMATTLLTPAAGALGLRPILATRPSPEARRPEERLAPLGMAKSYEGARVR